MAIGRKKKQDSFKSELVTTMLVALAVVLLILIGSITARMDQKIEELDKKLEEEILEYREYSLYIKNYNKYLDSLGTVYKGLSPSLVKKIRQTLPGEASDIEIAQEYLTHKKEYE